MTKSLATLLALLPLVASCASEEDDHGDDGSLFEDAYDANQGDGKEDGGCSGVVVPDRNGFNKRVVLTFDDGPNPATTPKVIEVLKKHHAPATFFNNGSRYAVAGAKELAARIAADPDFILANHSQHHWNLGEKDGATVTQEIAQTDALIRAAGETPKYFRFPFGSATCEGKRIAQSKGYIVTGWHIDSADWCYAATGGQTCKKSTFKYVPDELRNDMQGYIMSQVRAFNGGIILFHDVHQSTADHLDAVLTAMENAGFSFARLDDTALLPKLHGTAAPAAKFVGDTCATDADCAFAGGSCHPAGFCTKACAGACPDQSGKAPTFCIADERADNTGLCVSKAAVQNNDCASLVNTEKRVEDRFIGASSASPATATVCAPL